MALTKYSGSKVVTFTDEGCGIIEVMASKGVSDSTIARQLGTNAKVLHRVMADDDKVADAMTVGRGRLADELTDLLLVAAREGNITAMIYLSKSRLGWRDQGPVPKNQGNAVQVNITIPEPMSEAEFRNLIQVKEVSNEPNKTN